MEILHVNNMSLSNTNDRRYFVLIDDIWTTRSWDEIQLCFSRQQLWKSNTHGYLEYGGGRVC